VTVPEAVIAAGCGVMGVRSLVRSLRRPFEPIDTRDRLQFALFVTASAGWWITLGFFFLAYGLVEEPQDLRWFLLVPIALGGVQLLSGLGLSHAEDRRAAAGVDPELNGHEPREDST
jgi:hypothetical protein